MFEKFTERARGVMELARIEAQRLNSEFIGTEHMLIGMLLEEDCGGSKALKHFGIPLKAVRIEVEQLITPTTTPTVSLGQTPFSPRAKRAIEFAFEEAGRMKSTVVSTGHLLCGIYREKESIAHQVLTTLGITDLDRLRDEVGVFERDTRAEGAVPSETTDDPYTVKAKIRLFRKAQATEHDLSVLMVAGNAYVEAESITLGGVTNVKIPEIAAEIARKHDTDVYILDIS